MLKKYGYVRVGACSSRVEVSNVSYNVKEIIANLEKLNKEYGITILFITHDMHLAIEYTDRAIVFSEGGCIGDDSVFKILSDEE